ncbi:MAG: hypothetical protein M3Q95_03040 [Bacteroidota bacterium]|nr:hypothetical protein [Bacteroidota bacterium]
MKPFLALMLMTFSIMGLSGCYYDVAEELYPGNGTAGCDTSSVTYSLTVKPILDQNCMSCHSQALQQGGVILETHADVVTYVTSGQLLGSINHLSGFSPMPQGGPKLNDCNILKIETWVQAGALNN